MRDCSSFFIASSRPFSALSSLASLSFLASCFATNFFWCSATATIEQIFRPYFRYQGGCERNRGHNVRGYIIGFRSWKLIAVSRKRVVETGTTRPARRRSGSGGLRRVTASLAMYRRSVGSGMRKYRSQCYVRGRSNARRSDCWFTGKYTCTIPIYMIRDSEKQSGRSI